ncbi:uncharacterized protein J3D65DRAFT_690628, partial [Phyllosticta citribraziliensis]
TILLLHAENLLPQSEHHLPKSKLHLPKPGHHLPKSGHQLPKPGHRLPKPGHRLPKPGHHLPKSGQFHNFGSLEKMAANESSAQTSKAPEMAGPVRLRLKFKERRRRDPFEKMARERAHYNMKSNNLYRQFFEKLEKDIKFIRDDIDDLNTTVSQALVKAYGGDPGTTVEDALAMDDDPTESLRQLISQDFRPFDSSRKIGRHLKKLALQPLIPIIQGLRLPVGRSTLAIQKTLSNLPGHCTFEQELEKARDNSLKKFPEYPEAFRVAADSLDILVQELDDINKQKEAVKSFLHAYKRTYVEGKDYPWHIKDANLGSWRTFARAVPVSGKIGTEMDMKVDAATKAVGWYQHERIADFERQLDLLNKYEETLSTEEMLSAWEKPST